MAQKEGSRKKSRGHKESSGKRRSSRKVPLSEVQKVQMGKGMMSLESHKDRPKPKGKGTGKKPVYREVKAGEDF